jgi:transcriptional regulator with XRE-family HTH domain
MSIFCYPKTNMERKMNIDPEKLVALRKERGWSQEKLAAICGISERTIQRVERDGLSSLDTKMALASALGIAPSDLQAKSAAFQSTKIMVTSWAGALGLLILGTIAPIVILITAQNGKWEIASMTVVWSLTIVLVLMNFGFKATYNLFDNTSWIVRYPSQVEGLNTFIIQAKATIEYAYIVGIVAFVVSALTITVHGQTLAGNSASLLSYAVRPLIYSILFAELWFRPYKKRMEMMLYNQMAGSSLPA